MSAMDILASLELQFDQTLLMDRARLWRRWRRLQQQRPDLGPQQFLQHLTRLQSDLQRAVERYQRRESLLPAVRFETALPILEHRDQIVQSLMRHQTIVVAGETGSGKSTQLPKLCLEAG